MNPQDHVENAGAVQNVPLDQSYVIQKLQKNQDSYTGFVSHQNISHFTLHHVTEIFIIFLHQCLK